MTATNQLLKGDKMGHMKELTIKKFSKKTVTTGHDTINNLTLDSTIYNLTIKADPNNSQNVLIGSYELPAGEKIELEGFIDTSTLNITGEDTDKIYWLGLTQK